MDDRKTEMLLTELLEEMKLLTCEIKSNALLKFRKEFLTSELRVKMYSAFDGERTLQEISQDIDCKLNTLQIFVQSLIEKDLVDFYTRGTSRIIKKSPSKIALFYTQKTLTEEE